jgi:hypothetical protein
MKVIKSFNKFFESNSNEINDLIQKIKDCGTTSDQNTLCYNDNEGKYIKTFDNDGRVNYDFDDISEYVFTFMVKIFNLLV